MSQAANVSSIEALERFRNALIVYLEKVRPPLEDAHDEVARTREWIRQDRRLFWENKVRQGTRRLSEAEQALFSADLARLRAPSYAEKNAVLKAKRELEEAQEKIRVLKSSLQRFETDAQPKINQLEQLRTLLRRELPEAIRQLGEITKRLETYLGTTISKPSVGEGADKPGPAL
jgi:hypothetical protein